MIRIVFHTVFILILAGIGWILLSFCTAKDRRKSAGHERRTGLHGLVLYYSFFWLATVVLSLLVFPILNAIRLFFITGVYFGAGRERESYITAVFNTVPVAGISVVFFVIFLFIVLSIVVFSQTGTGRKVLSESSSLFLWIAEHFFSYLLMIFQFLPFLFGLSYSKKRGTSHSEDSGPAELLQNVSDRREYQFVESLPDTYAVFLRRLVKYRTTDEKIGFAYLTICRLYKKKIGTLKKSDTPWEIAHKVKYAAGISEEEVNSVRQIIERVKFSADHIDGVEKNLLLEELCRNVRFLL